MDRRRYLRLRRFAPLFALLRLCGAAALVLAGIWGMDYIRSRSDAEMRALKKPQQQIYLGANSVKMTVVDDQGQLVMDITGKSVALSQDQSKASFKDADAQYYANGRTELAIHAGQIDYDTRSEDFHISKGDSTQALTVTTSDGWTVSTDELEWRRFKETAFGGGAKPPSFRFPKGVHIENRDGNKLDASYMQADKDLQYMEFVGNFNGNIRQLNDTQFISQRNLTDVNKLKVKDFTNLEISAEQVIYDKKNQVVLATSRYYDRPFRIKDFDGNIVDVAHYQPAPQQVVFKKPEATIAADHIEAHLNQKWAESFGNISMDIPPDYTKKYGEDKSLTEMKKKETKIAAGDIEYWWGKDAVLTKDRTVVTQEDRRAEADQIYYFGPERKVYLEGNLRIIQGSGDWLTQANLVDIKDQDQARVTKGYTELTGDKAQVYLNNNDFIADGNVMARQDNREVAADEIVYQDRIKRMTATGNVKYRDVDGQSFVGNSLVYHNQTEYMAMDAGMGATIRLPAKYANDINRSIAQMREKPVPADISDPAVPDEPKRNPNTSADINVPEIAGGKSEGALGIPGFIGPAAPKDLGKKQAKSGKESPGFIGPIAPSHRAPAKVEGFHGSSLDMELGHGKGMLPQMGAAASVTAKPAAKTGASVPAANAKSATGKSQATPPAQPPAAKASGPNVAEVGASKYAREKQRQEKR